MKIDPLRIQYLRLVAERDGRIFTRIFSDRRDRRRRGNVRLIPQFQNIRLEKS